MRASVAAEKLGLPTASICCSTFLTQVGFTAAGLGMPNLPISAYPGHIDLHSDDEMKRNIETVVVDQVIKSLTVQPKEVKIPVQREPQPRDIVLKGTFEEINKFFYEHEWGDGLPIVPPTIDKVEEFLKYTDYPADKVIGELLPDTREATVWNIAVNGVMAGCRPEYMPVLIALIEIMTEPKFFEADLSCTPGPEIQITVNGPIIKDLEFNYEQGALRNGFQANTSIGRFWRLYLRNVAGFLPHKTDKATFGGNFRVVMAENEDFVAKIGWVPMSVDQGFKAGDNVVTCESCTSFWMAGSVGASNAEEILDKLSAHIVDIQINMFGNNTRGTSVVPHIMLSPIVAEAIARGGYSKEKVRQYFFDHARFPAKRFDNWSKTSICEYVEQGVLPKQFCESKDPDRLVPIVWTVKDFLITVSGDTGRDNCYITCENGRIGYPTSKIIKLPANWGELLKEAKKK